MLRLEDGVVWIGGLVNCYATHQQRDVRDNKKTYNRKVHKFQD